MYQRISSWLLHRLRDNTGDISANTAAVCPASVAGRPNCCPQSGRRCPTVSMSLPPGCTPSASLCSARCNTSACPNGPTTIAHAKTQPTPVCCEGCRAPQLHIAAAWCIPICRHPFGYRPRMPTIASKSNKERFPHSAKGTASPRHSPGATGRRRTAACSTSVAALVPAPRARSQPVRAGEDCIIHTYNNLKTKPDSHVRLQAAVVLQRLVQGLHKGLAPHLRDLLPHWLLSCNDPYRAAATAAGDALTQLLPREDRRAAAIAMAAQPVR